MSVYIIDKCERFVSQRAGCGKAASPDSVRGVRPQGVRLLDPRGYSQYLLQGQYLKNHSFFCPYLLKLTMINIQGLLHIKVRQSLSNG